MSAVYLLIEPAMPQPPVLKKVLREKGNFPKALIILEAQPPALGAGTTKIPPLHRTSPTRATPTRAIMSLQGEETAPLQPPVTGPGHRLTIHCP